ncbi:hypothetical protein CDAR_394391 [Caerostris darwini]|uniref:Uncharacterized protein n=1 Tax=Caerostris darwini TaxID=1538125 RepID=A0AAV4RJG6_9ARAC|nr:hypothetical protein CDAR_394391 [Caerostris darwini]
MEKEEAWDGEKNKNKKYGVVAAYVVGVEESIQQDRRNESFSISATEDDGEFVVGLFNNHFHVKVMLFIILENDTRM